jgi:hypothetical protein
MEIDHEESSQIRWTSTHATSTFGLLAQAVLSIRPLVAANEKLLRSLALLQKVATCAGQQCSLSPHQSTFQPCFYKLSWSNKVVLRLLFFLTAQPRSISYCIATSTYWHLQGELGACICICFLPLQGPSNRHRSRCSTTLFITPHFRISVHLEILHNATGSDHYCIQ